MNRKLAVILTSIGLLLVIAEPAMAEDFSELVERWIGHFSSSVKLVTSAAFACGIFFVGTAIYQFRKLGVANGMGQMSAKNPLITLIAGAALLYLTTIAGIGGQTLFGKGAQTSGVEGTTEIPY